MLEHANYCPILHTRLAETKALFELSGATKDRLFPIIVWRPWPNARLLGHTAQKIADALDGRRFALDLDRTRISSGADTAAAEEFRLLFDEADGHARYYDFVRAVPNAVPVLRPSALQLNRQLAHIESLDRGVVVRVEWGAAAELVQAARALVQTTPDVVILVDAGWSRDLLIREAWASSIIQAITEVRPEVELIVSGSSFPDAFAGIRGRATIPLLERRLHTELVRQHNAANLLYGDWGSTRPPAIDTGIMRNTPRIDLPLQAEWLCYRQASDEGYPELARQLMADRMWPRELTIWGTHMIVSTADALPGSIRSPNTAAAARINIHLHRQAYVGAEVVPGDTEEPYVDVV
jgi:hypothetical protein